MTLAQRLLVAISVLTVATTAVLGLAVREAWRRTEEERFQAQFEAAIHRLETELAEDVRDLPALVRPLCEHDPVLDSALVDLRGGKLDPGRRLALSLRVPELAKALRLDELVLFTGGGEILGAFPGGKVGAKDPRLAGAPGGDTRTARVRKAPVPLSIEARCGRSAADVSIGLYAARHLDTLLHSAGASQGLSLSLSAPAAGADMLVSTMHLALLEGIPVVATRSRLPLLEALERLDLTIVALGAGTLLLAMGVAAFLSRGLARPIVDLSDQARRITSGDPVPVRGRGGRELEELARSFNQAISDLAAMRKRLAATERIAARREIARRVAHEIKNPLAPIRAAVETLRRLRARGDPAFDEYFDEASRTVLDEVQRIAGIVQEFTRFARLPPPHPAPMDLAKAVEDVVALHSAGGARIDLIAAPLPKVVADRDQVVQVVTNLVQNALDAVRDVPAPRVVVEVQSRGPDRACIVVRDNGKGVPAEFKDRLFEPYATTKEHGTGLGLAIAQRIAIEHGGDLTYRDAPAGGAEFTVSLPLSGPSLLPEAPPESSRS